MSGPITIPTGPDLTQLRAAASNLAWGPDTLLEDLAREFIRQTDGLATMRAKCVELLGRSDDTIDHGPDLDWFASPDQRELAYAMVRELILIGLEDEQVAYLTGMSEGDVEAAHESGRIGIPRQRLVRDILRLRTRGYYNAEIADELGVSKVYVGKMLNKAGIERTPTQSWIKGNAQEILDLWNEGYTARWIAEHLDTGLYATEWVIRRARNEGLNVRVGAAS